MFRSANRLSSFMVLCLLVCVITLVALGPAQGQRPNDLQTRVDALQQEVNGLKEQLQFVQKESVKRDLTLQNEINSIKGQVNALKAQVGKK